jgi:putative endonuclease
MDGETIVFVEVKTRSGIGAGEPVESVDSRKQERMRERPRRLRCAAAYRIAR